MVPDSMGSYAMGSLSHLNRNNRGSFILSAIFFIVIFMMIAGFAVDLSSYLNKKAKLQNMADGAAKTAGRALQQYRNYPNIDNGYKQVWAYIKERQGKNKFEIYPHSGQMLTGANDLKDNIVFRRMETNCGDPTASKYFYREANGDTQLISSCYGSSSDTFYLSGVAMVDHFEPLFLPNSVFGVRLSGISAVSVARVEPTTLEKIKSIPTDTEPMNCGIIISDNDGDMDGSALEANNFTLGGGDLCSNGDLTFGDSSENENANNLNVSIEQWEGANCIVDRSNNNPCDDDDADNAYRSTFDDRKDEPSFHYTNPDSYGVVINESNYDSWSTCPGRPGKETPEGFCVKETSSGQYELSENVGSSSNKKTIYVDGSLTVSGNNTTVHGGIYAGGAIEVTDNNIEFRGDPDVLGGLAAWSEGDLTVDGNNNVVRGIFGAEGDLSFTNNGGGNGDFQGILFGNGDFNWENNSNATTLELDKSRFNYSSLDMGDWRVAKSTEPRSDDIKKPLFANVSVSLVDVEQ